MVYFLIDDMEKEGARRMMFAFEDRFALFDVTPVDNQFIQEYLPGAKGDYVRVYLYGLMRCYHPDTEMNEDQMAHDLGMTKEDVMAAYRYWERRGLVRRVSDEPVQFQYVSLRHSAMAPDAVKIDPEYEAFGEALHSAFGNERRLHGGEIQTCYEWVEELKLSREAVIMLMKYMAKTKGKNFSVKSAEKLAAQMAEENIRTVEQVEDFLGRDQEMWNGTKKVLRKLGKTNLPSEDQVKMYRGWRTDWGFTHEAIMAACAETAKGDPTMGHLENILRLIRERCGEKSVIDLEDIEADRKIRAGSSKMTAALGKSEWSRENYTIYRKLLEKYPDDMIQQAAKACGRSQQSAGEIEKMLESWSSKGIHTGDEAKQYIREFDRQSEILSELRSAWGLKSRMGQVERAMLSKWLNEYGYDRRTITAAAKFASGTEKPMAYLDKILGDYAEKGIRTIGEMEKERKEHGKSAGKSAGKSEGRKVSAQNYTQRDYSGGGTSVADMMAQLQEEQN